MVYIGIISSLLRIALGGVKYRPEIVDKLTEAVRDVLAKSSSELRASRRT
ncbi:MAG TPA: hypothetical protein VJH22_06255 [Candidatus Nanoarchaeia archaeon]|nr:hypothetical protein [Candidatus Nanoarchaeia archaeon]